MKTDIIIISSIYPFGTSEQFLELETEYWAENAGVNVTVMPKRMSSIQRSLPYGIDLNTSCSLNKGTSLLLLKAFLRVFFSSLLYRELNFQIFFKPGKILRALLAGAKYFYFLEVWDKFFRQRADNDPLICYTYWFDESTYALSSLKNKYDFKLITRAHGDDVYEYANPYSYLPYRRQFINDPDRIFTVTDGGKTYLQKQFNADEHTIETARLGVRDHGIVCRASNAGCMNLLSCSYIVQVKRIDKIIDAVFLIAKGNPELKITWTHIGSGEMEEEMKKYAERVFASIQNVDYCFVGHLDNSQVFSFYKENNVDLFINLSESEGVPVSIMEALSCSVPVVAPNIGGVKDLVETDFNGVLLEPTPELENVATACSHIMFFKSDKTRRNAYHKFQNSFNAESNYRHFIRRVTEIIDE